MRRDSPRGAQARLVSGGSPGPAHPSSLCSPPTCLSPRLVLAVTLSPGKYRALPSLWGDKGHVGSGRDQG